MKLTQFQYRIIIPRDNVTLTLVLAGIRAPKTARNDHERSEPYGPEAAEFATRKFMQRDVEIEFEAVDKSGGFIGAMYYNKTENAALVLVKEGLATVHAHSVEGLAWAKALVETEEEATKARKNVCVQFCGRCDVVLTKWLDLGGLYRGRGACTRG
jgi:staphylococcal nuclease domain-containing protein 1